MRTPELVFEYTAQYGIEVDSRIPYEIPRRYAYPSKVGRLRLDGHRVLPTTGVAARV
jgi:hypothetical protein